MVYGYNTELPEQLHIDLTKELYQATNKKEYMQQMVKILYQLETLDAFIAFMKWAILENKNKDGLTMNNESNNDLDDKEDGNSNDRNEELEAISFKANGHVKTFLPKDFLFKSVLVESIKQDFSTSNFIECLLDFLKSALPHNKYIH